MSAYLSQSLNPKFSWISLNQSKRVFHFAEGSLSDIHILGHKGANLCEMTRLKLPVPPG